MMNLEESYTPRKYFKALKYALMDFMTHTSIHGAKYVCEDGRYFFERLVWIILLGVGTGTGSFMVLNIYERYAGTPIVSVIEHSHYPTWRLPFPALTICNNNRILQTRAEAMVAALKIPEHVNRSNLLNDLRVLGELSSTELTPDTKSAAYIQNILNFNDLTIEDAMHELSQPCSEMLERCSWQNEIVKCSDLFELRKSHLGYCCSFNYVGTRDSPKSAPVEPQKSPIHTRLYGQRMGLTVLVNPAIDDYFVSSYISAGIMVHVHNYDTYPGESVIMKMVPMTKEVLMPIRISSRVCSDGVSALQPTVRECLLEEENHLEVFEKYDDENCLTECRMNYSLSLCSCIPYYFPNTGKHRICDLTDAPCLHENFNILHSFKPGTASELKAVTEEHNEDLQRVLDVENAMACDCPTQCNLITYQARVSWGDFTASKHSVNPLFGPETNDTNRIFLHVFAESNFSQVDKRDVASTPSALLGLLGGVCCIFLGCSFISLVEIMYFTIVRLPGFFNNTKPTGESCPASPRNIRKERFPSVRTNNARFIQITPWSSGSGHTKSIK